jgi:hypothetical protein
MLKRGILIIFGMFLLVVSSCTEGPTQQGAFPQGVDVQFVEGYPDNVLIEDDGFNVNLEVSNSLSYPVDYSLCIYGDRADYYGGVPVSGVCKDELKVSAGYENQNDVITPTTQTIRFPSDSSTFVYTNLDKGVGGVNIRAIINYGITSEASVDVCVLESKSYESEGEFVCLTKETLSNFDIVQESSPLIVSRVEKDIRNVGGIPQMRVLIYLDKASQGKIVRGYEEQFDKITLGVSLRGTEAQFSCTNQDGHKRVIFREGDAIECKANLDVGNGNVYKDSLVINLGYPYELERKKPVSFDSSWEA